jgi:hypothetical protein
MFTNIVLESLNKPKNRNNNTFNKISNTAHIFVYGFKVKCFVA